MNSLLGHGLDLELALVRGARVDEAGGLLVDEDVVQTGLVAADARVDLVRALLHRLLHEVRVRQERTRHAHHVRLAYGEKNVKKDDECNKIEERCVEE